MNPKLRILPLVGLAAAAVAACSGTGSSDATSDATSAAPSPQRTGSCSAPSTTSLAGPDGWAARIAHRPDTVGLVVDDGRGHVVRHRADTAFPLASASKVVHLVAYAAAVADGRLAPGDRVSVADWERWYTPGADALAHPKALRRLGLHAGDTATVDQLVSAMIRESDNSAADWLRARLGDPALTAAARSVGWDDVDLPSFAGAVVRLARPDLATAGTSRRSLGPLDARLGRRYAADPVFARATMQAYEQRATTDPKQFVGTVRRWADTTAHGTPADLLGAYRALATNAVPGAAVARRQLEWQGHQSSLDGTLGFKAGSYPGVLTLGSFLRRDDGTTGYAIVLGRDLPVLEPSQAQQTAGQQRLVLDALTGRSGFERVRCAA